MISTSMNTGRIKYYDDYDCEEEKNTVLVRVDAGAHSGVYPVLLSDGADQPHINNLSHGCMGIIKNRY